MCGIAVDAHLGRPHPPDASGVEAMAAAQRHRGPDGWTETVTGPARLAFGRLAIVAPHSGGQPFRSADGLITVLVNGEIYNHGDLRRRLRDTPWRTASDCEAVLHAYLAHPAGFADALRGMFAGVIVDLRSRELVMFTDPFGVKPLFYLLAADRLLVASETKALCAHPAADTGVDWSAALTDPYLSGALAFHEEPAGSWLRGIRMLRAGTVVRVDLATGRTSEQRYWHPETSREPAAADPVAAYAEAFAASARRCASQGEQRNVAVMLSGGIDSAAVAAVAARYTPVTSYTVRTHSTAATGDLAGARRTARALGLVHVEVDVDAPGPWSPGDYLRVLWVCESPLVGPEQLYKHEINRLVRARQAGPVVLSGQGSDEYNGGYSDLLSGGLGWDAFLDNLAALWEPTPRGRSIRAWTPRTGPTMVSDSFSAGTPGPDATWRAYVRMKHRDVQQFNTWTEDRLAAAHGCETRVPFLDTAVVETALQVAPQERQALLWDKQILRRAAASWLPPESVTAPKVPFFYGPGQRHARDEILNCLLQDDAALIALAFEAGDAPVDATAVVEAVRGVRAGGAGAEAWLAPVRLVNLGLLDGLARGRIPAPGEVGRELVADYSDFAEHRTVVTG
ncbi:asparagine synthetase B family protein [Streptomyces sp. NPDC017435]|uniref:asparagine synthetase B family protein n=1 Tax=Streptomyces sp. NPDC017435 TaxID=3364995 RepID=UPI0037A8CC43